MLLLQSLALPGSILSGDTLSPSGAISPSPFLQGEIPRATIALDRFITKQQSPIDMILLKNKNKIIRLSVSLLIIIFVLLQYIKGNWIDPFRFIESKFNNLNKTEESTSSLSAIGLFQVYFLCKKSPNLTELFNEKYKNNRSNLNLDNAIRSALSNNNPDYDKDINIIMYSRGIALRKFSHPAVVRSYGYDLTGKNENVLVYSMRGSYGLVGMIITDGLKLDLKYGSDSRNSRPISKIEGC